MVWKKVELFPDVDVEMNPAVEVEVVMEGATAVDPMMLEMSILVGLGFASALAVNDLDGSGGGGGDVC